MHMKCPPFFSGNHKHERQPLILITIIIIIIIIAVEILQLTLSLLTCTCSKVTCSLLPGIFNYHSLLLIATVPQGFPYFLIVY